MVDAISDTHLWPVPYAPGPVTATVRPPGSKSMTNRHLVLAAIATGTSVLHHPLVSRDTTLMRAALESFGVRFTATGDNDTWHVEPPETLRAAGVIDAGLAGTVMRFLPPVAALAHGSTTFDGDAAARTRPISALLDTLSQLGVQITSAGTAKPGDTHPLSVPFTVHGTGSVGAAGEVDIDAAASSQFVSSVLLAGARFEGGVSLTHTGSGLPSRPHINMTLQALARVGVQATEKGPGQWRVEPGRPQAIEIDIEPDLSSAAPFLALAAVTGGTITVAGWPQQTTQAGAALREILTSMGARVQFSDAGLHVTGPPRGELVGLDVDLHDVGELTPVIAAAAATARTPSVLRGVAHLRGHETDRLHALETELSAMGSNVTQTPDGLIITPAPLHGTQFHTYHDHRIAMAGAVLGAVVPGTTVHDVATTAKTFPGFADLWSAVVNTEPASQRPG